MATPLTVNPAQQTQFPPVAEVEFQQSTLSIPIVANGDVKEVVKMTAVLRLDRGAPVTNAGGHRQFEFAIETWEVAGYSEFLGEWITITLSDSAQPRSLAIAQQAGADYPATIVYNAIFDVFVGKRMVAEKVTGLGVGVNAYEVPPKVNIQFQKAFPLGQNIDAVAGACAEEAKIDPNLFMSMADEFRALRS
ncbi:MAG TPA: hypothetical protein VHZ03_29670 [Trebonia sp.]|jgi:hypothetical protein|nr:hypothetical protein [Trebonia sp.]